MSKYVIFDLEMCRVPKNHRTELFTFSRELIQIGAVLMDESYTVIDSFITYVSPRFGVLDAEVIKLTGITRDKLSGAPSTEEALFRFANWIPDDAILVEWSENDRWQLYDELDGKNICNDRLEDFLDNIIDCQEAFAKK